MIKFDTSEAIFNPKGYGGLDGARAKMAVFILDEDHWNRIIESETKMKKLTDENGKEQDSVRLTKAGRIDVIISNGGDKGPTGTIDVMENLIASGVQAVVAFGKASAIKKEIDTATIVIPSSAVRDEGVSYHYLPDSDEVEQDAETLKILREEMRRAELDFISGKTWTTDALYRKTIDKREMMKDDGCVCLESECASLLSVSKFRNIKFVEFMITLDNIDSKDPTNFTLYRHRYSDKMYDAALATAKRLTELA